MKISNEYYNFLDPSVISASFGANGSQSFINMGDFYLKTLYLKNNSNNNVDSVEIKDGNGIYNFKGSSVNTNLLNTDTSSWTDAYFKQDSLDMLSATSVSSPSISVNYDASVYPEDILNHGVSDGTISSYLKNNFTLSYYWPAIIWIGNFDNDYKAISDASFIFDSAPSEFDSDVSNGKSYLIDISQLKAGISVNNFPQYGLYVAIPVENTADSNFSFKWKDITDNDMDWRSLPVNYFDPSYTAYPGLISGYFPGDLTGFTDTSSMHSASLSSLTEINSCMKLSNIFSMFFDSSVPSERLKVLQGNTSSSLYNKNYKVFRFPLIVYNGNQETLKQYPFGIEYNSNTRLLINYNNHAGISEAGIVPTMNEMAYGVGTDYTLFYWLYPDSVISNGSINYKECTASTEKSRKHYIFWDDLPFSSEFGKEYPYMFEVHQPAFCSDNYYDSLLKNDSSYQSMLSFYAGTYFVPNNEQSQVQVFYDVSAYPLNIDLQKIVGYSSGYFSAGTQNIHDFGAGTGFANDSIFKAMGSKFGITYNDVSGNISNYSYNPMFNYASMSDSCTYIQYKIKDTYKNTNNYRLNITPDSSNVSINEKFYISDRSYQIGKSTGTSTDIGNGTYVGLPLIVCGCIISDQQNLSLNEIGNCIRKFFIYTPEMSYGNTITSGIAMVDTSYYNEFNPTVFPSILYNATTISPGLSDRHSEYNSYNNGQYHFRYVSDGSNYCMYNKYSSNLSGNTAFSDNPYFYLFAAVNEKCAQISDMTNVIMNVEMEAPSYGGQIAYNTMNFQKGTKGITNDNDDFIVYSPAVGGMGEDYYWNGNQYIDQRTSEFTLADSALTNSDVAKSLTYKFIVSGSFRSFTSNSFSDYGGSYFRLYQNMTGLPINNLTITGCWFDNNGVTQL